MNPVDQLCPNCGLCCDNTLFADVELCAEDDPRRLSELGLSLMKKGRDRLAFAQPCACFDGKFCKIYADRPKHCKLFECALLKKVITGDMKADDALKKISEAKALANKMRRLLKSLNQSDKKTPDVERYAQAMSEPIDLSDETSSPNRQGQLMQAFSDLMDVVQNDFLQE